jgi:hypothetical protein
MARAEALRRSEPGAVDSPSLGVARYGVLQPQAAYFHFEIGLVWPPSGFTGR